MTGATLAYLAIALVTMVLPIAALRGRGLRGGQLLRSAAIWVALFVLVALVFSGLRA